MSVVEARSWLRLRFARKKIGQPGCLESASTPSDKQIKDDDQEDEAEAAAAVVAEAWTHIVATAAEKQEKDHKNEYERHGEESSRFPFVSYLVSVQRPHPLYARPCCHD
jgi:IMP cyclohydrolase